MPQLVSPRHTLALGAALAQTPGPLPLAAQTPDTLASPPATPRRLKEPPDAFAPTTTVRTEINGVAGALDTSGGAVDRATNTAAGLPLLDPLERGFGGRGGRQPQPEGVGSAGAGDPSVLRSHRFGATHLSRAMG
ncbi:MAG: hypothetical protein ACK587_16805 [Cyanobacteriota bacterium]